MSVGVPFTFRTIEQYFLCLILDNGPKHFKEGLFGSLQRELSTCIYLKKPRLKIHLLVYAHFFKYRREWFEANLVFEQRKDTPLRD